MLLVSEKGLLYEVEDSEEFLKKNKKYELKVKFILNPLDRAQIDFFKFQLDDPLEIIKLSILQKIKELLHLDDKDIPNDEMIQLYDLSRKELYDLYLNYINSKTNKE